MSDLTIRLSAEELAWIKHAARLKHETVATYVKLAINNRLCSAGVDAVLLRISERAERKGQP